MRAAPTRLVTKRTLCFGMPRSTVSQPAALGLQIEIPSAQDLDAVAGLTQTPHLRQKLLYIGCMSAAAASANFHQNVDTTVPMLEQLALDDYQPEEVKLEVALQLGPLGNPCGFVCKCQL